MATIQEEVKNTVYNRINSKTVDYSIAKTDVGNTFNEMVDLLGATEANIDLRYNRGWFVKKTGTPMRFYVAINDNVSGDVTNTSNWVELTTEGVGNGRLVSKVINVETTIAQNYNITYYVPISLSLADNSGAMMRYILTGVQTTHDATVAYAITVSFTNATDGDCVLLDMQTMGAGQSILVLPSGQGMVRALSNNATYLLTYQSNAVDGKNYTLRQVSENGFTKVINYYTQKVGTGKVLLQAVGDVVPYNITLPIAALNEGKEVEIVISAGIIASVLADVGDTIVNSPTFPISSGSLRYISNGQNKWIYV